MESCQKKQTHITLLSFPCCRLLTIHYYAGSEVNTAKQVGNVWQTLPNKFACSPFHWRV